MNDPARASALGFTQLIAFLAVALFAPAGTFDFPRAWLYLCVFATSTGLITAYLWKVDPGLLARRSRGGPQAEREPAQKLIQVAASLAFIGLLVVPALDRRFSWSHVPMSVSIAGDAIVALGFFSVFIVFRENTFAGSTIEVAADQRVVSTGPYAIVRHPMYAGALVMLLGTPLALGSWWGLLMLVSFTLVIARRLLEEEKFLAKNLAGYSAYMRRIHYRLVPFIW
jgi:protein-S-isoprenylcysteine O-methyltransferase Ste14